MSVFRANVALVFATMFVCLSAGRGLAARCSADTQSCVRACLNVGQSDLKQCTTECSRGAHNAKEFCFGRFEDGPPFSLTHEQLVAMLQKLYAQDCSEKYNCTSDDRACFLRKECLKSCSEIGQRLGFPADVMQEGCPPR
jgi:hypothetical protein